jgi:hypothetical protein
MRRVRAARGAVLLQLEPVGIVTAIFHRSVVAIFTLGAFESNPTRIPDHLQVTTALPSDSNTLPCTCQRVKAFENTDWPVSSRLLLTAACL